VADPYEFPVDRSAIMLFARALGDIRPEYSDPNDPATQAVGGIVIPPTFVQSSAHWQPEYPMDMTRPRKNPRPASEPAPKRTGRGLHAEQHYEYHHPVHAGDTLTATSKPGETWEKQGRRGGKLLFSEGVTEYRNQDGVLCNTAHAISVQTERAVDA
jgi:hypothetical protein